jgi:hypothetical protein
MSTAGVDCVQLRNIYLVSLLQLLPDSSRSFPQNLILSFSLTQEPLHTFSASASSP